MQLIYNVVSPALLRNFDAAKRNQEFTALRPLRNTAFHRGYLLRKLPLLLYCFQIQSKATCIIQNLNNQ
ncbi:MAG: hypothetical protein D0531_00705 [Methylococcales bacterium]|nr:MAG: hypothetical protein D0531_00705 [Methylococcales bacterium]